MNLDINNINKFKEYFAFINCFKCSHIKDDEEINIIDYYNQIDKLFFGCIPIIGIPKFIDIENCNENIIKDNTYINNLIIIIKEYESNYSSDDIKIIFESTEGAGDFNLNFTILFDNLTDYIKFSQSITDNPCNITKYLEKIIYFNNDDELENNYYYINYIIEKDLKEFNINDIISIDIQFSFENYVNRNEFINKLCEMNININDIHTGFKFVIHNN